MYEVTADAGTLMRQAGETAGVYLHAAKEEIDMLFGDGYAVRHPELIGAFIQAAALDFQAAQINIAAQLIADALNALAGDMLTVGNQIESIAPSS